MVDREDETILRVEDGPLAGAYVAGYDPWANNRTGMVVGTHSVDAALGFPSAVEAIEFYRQSAGWRPDGKPNRPLTASSVSFLRRHMARKEVAKQSAEV